MKARRGIRAAPLRGCGSFLALAIKKAGRSVKAKKHRITRLYMYAAKAARLQKTAVGLTPFMRFFSATFCGCWSLLRKALSRNRKTSYTAVPLYAILP